MRRVYTRWKIQLKYAASSRAGRAHLDEELSIKVGRGRVEGTAVDGRVDVVLGGNGMRREEVDDLSGAKASVPHAQEDLVGRVLRERDQAVGRRDGVVRPAREELEARAAETVADAYSTSKLDAIGW